MATGRFGQTLREQIEGHHPEYLTGFGNVNLRAFAENVQGYRYETVRKAAVGERAPTMELMEAVARTLGVPPETFYEYKLLRAQQDFDPEVVGLETALANVERWVERES